VTIATKDRLSRADIVTMIEDFLVRRLSISQPEFKKYGLNVHATVLAKLRNQRKYLGYNFSFIEDTVQTLGNAEAIKTLDSTAQLILITTKTKKHTRKHENTEDLLDTEDIDTLGDDET